MKKIQKAGMLLIVVSLMMGLCACGAGESSKEQEEKKATGKQETEQKQEEAGVNTSDVNEEIPNDGKFHGQYMVTGEYVKEHVDDPNVLFVDARGWKQAVLGTVKGAIATTWQDLCTCQEGKAGDETWGKIPEKTDLEKRLGDLGMTQDKEIILIADTVDGWGDDARILWELVAAGYDNVKMIDGGYQAAKDAGAETQLLASKASPEKVTIEQMNTAHVMTTEELQKEYENYTIVDVRTDEEYNGEVLYDEAKGGHLPGAIHVRYTDLFQENGQLKSNQDITAMFEAAGVRKDDKIVTYCTGGIRSAYTQLVLEMCGYEQTWNYDQSYWRWCVVGEVE